MSILESKITKEYDKRKIREFLKEELGLRSEEHTSELQSQR